eukprot:654064-Hanusia_phi.AAC.1
MIIIHVNLIKPRPKSTGALQARYALPPTCLSCRKLMRRKEQGAKEGARGLMQGGGERSGRGGGTDSEYKHHAGTRWRI